MKLSRDGLLALCGLWLLSSTALAMPESEFKSMRSQLLNDANADLSQAVSKVAHKIAELDGQLSPDQRIRLLYQQAIFQQRTNQSKAALATLALCKALSQPLNDPKILYSYHNILANIFSDAGLYQQALMEYEAALPLAALYDSAEFVRQTENNLALVLLELGQYDQAEHYFRNFLQQGQQMDSADHIAVALTNLGELAQKRLQWSTAEPLHQQALSLRVLNDLGQSWSFCALAQIAVQRQEWWRAAILAKQCLALKQGRQQVEQLDAQLLQAQVRIGQQDFAQAEQQLQSILTNARRSQLFKAEEQAWRLLVQLYEHQQKTAMALVAMKQWTQSREAVNRLRFDLSLAQNTANLSLATREAEISRLQQQQHDAFVQQRQLVAGIVGAGLLLLLILLFSLQLRRKQLALKQSLQELERTRSQLVEERKQAALSQMVCGLAHQLNTPLGTVLTAVSCANQHIQNLQQAFSDKTLRPQQLNDFINEQQQLLALASRSNERAAQLVERFKLISGKQLGTEQQAVELLSFSQCYLQDLGSLSGISAAQISVRGQPLTLQADLALLQQILHALCENSVIHSGLSTDALRLDLQISREDDNVQLIFTDNGQGLGDSPAEQLFDPFYTTKNSQGRLGLGLTIAFNAAHQAGGSLQYLPTASGCCFQLNLPYSDARI